MYSFKIRIANIFKSVWIRMTGQKNSVINIYIQTRGKWQFKKIVDIIDQKKSWCQSEPCGTPIEIGIGPEQNSLNFTNCSLPFH